MLLVEFCGVPGCGKSTLCNEIQEYFESQGYKIENLRLRNSHTTFLGKIKKIVYIIKLRTVALFYPVRTLAYKYGRSFNNKSAMFWSKRLVEGVYRINKAKGKIDIGFFDEGFVQYITSICYGYQLNSDSYNLISYLDSEIYRTPNNAIIFHCDLDQEENLRRLKERNRVDRYFSGTDSEIKKKLARKDMDLAKVCNTLNKARIININMLDKDNSKAIIIEHISKALMHRTHSWEDNK